eukprot:jgi/Orpsp1_1/1183909/evm.model.c7180000087184.1
MKFISFNRTSMVVNFRVIRDIKLGEELTVFYSDSYFGANNCDCLCESCEKKQLGGFSKPISDDASTSSENINKINHPVSTVMSHRRRAQPMSFKSDFEFEISDDYHCNICGRLILERNGICVGCLRHHKIFNLIWPYREKEKKNKKNENKHIYDDLSDFKDFFFNLIQNKEVDELYDSIYDFYNKNVEINDDDNVNTIITNNRNRIIRHISKKNKKHTNNDNLINEFLNGYGDSYSSKKQNRKRRKIMDDYLKELNREAKRKKFFIYNCSPSRLTYDTIAYYGFSDYTIDLNLDNYPEYTLFYEVIKTIKQHKRMDNKSNNNI